MTFDSRALVCKVSQIKNVNIWIIDNEHKNWAKSIMTDTSALVPQAEYEDPLKAIGLLTPVAQWDQYFSD